MDWHTLLQIALALGLRELAGWFLNRRKTSADADKVEAEAESVRLAAEAAIQNQLFTHMQAEMARMREELAVLRTRVDDCEVDRAELRAEIEAIKEQRG